jgi:hypothetical protein
MRPWRDEIVTALKALNGRGSLAEIYASIARVREPLRGQWQATVRSTLERHSSDSENYRGGDDLFFSIGGLGGGKWGLR